MPQLNGPIQPDPNRQQSARTVARDNSLPLARDSERTGTQPNAARGKMNGMPVALASPESDCVTTADTGPVDVELSTLWVRLGGDPARMPKSDRVPVDRVMIIVDPPQDECPTEARAKGVPTARTRESQARVDREDAVSKARLQRHLRLQDWEADDRQQVRASPAHRLPAACDIRALRDATPDVQIGPLLLARRDGKYKDILADLDHYRSFLDKMPLSQNSQAALDHLHAGLTTLEDRVQAYGPDRPGMRRILDGIAHERSLLTQLQKYVGPAALQGRKEGPSVPMSIGRALELGRLLPGVPDDSVREGELKRLGSGAVNTVYTASTLDDQGEQSGTGVVKFEIPPPRDDRPVVLENLAIEVDSHGLERPDFAQRNVASYLLDQALGFGVVPHTTLAVINGSFCSMMDKVGGIQQGATSVRTVLADTGPLVAHLKIRQQAEATIQSLKSKALRPVEDNLLNAIVTTQLTTLAFKASPPRNHAQLMQLLAQQPQLGHFQFEGAPHALAVSGQTLAIVRLADGHRCVTLEALDLAAWIDGAQAALQQRDYSERQLLQPLNALQAKTARELFEAPWADGKLQPDPDSPPNDRIRLQDEPNGKQSIGLTHTHVHPVDYAEADLARELTKLQLGDFLAGQLDRHWTNYFIERGQGKTRVHAIDNDLSWGASTERRASSGPTIDTPLPLDTRRSNCVGLPPFIDTDMQAAVLALQGTKLDSLTAELLRLLSPRQVSNFLERLQLLQAHVGDPQKVKVIAPAAWGDIAVPGKPLHALLDDGVNSYVGREHQGLQKFIDQARRDPTVVIESAFGTMDGASVTVASLVEAQGRPHPGDNNNNNNKT